MIDPQGKTLCGNRFSNNDPERSGNCGFSELEYSSDNIMLCSDGKAEHIDLVAAKQLLSERSKTLSVNKIYDIKKLTSENEDAFYRFTAEYLPDSDPERMKEFFNLYPEAFLLCEAEGELVGAAFGRDRSVQFPDDMSFELCGIAVRCDHQRKGCGRRLLAEFEKAAKWYGAKAVSLGSAEGYSKQFYISCGYIPTEYKVWENDSPCIKKTFSDIDDYRAYVRQDSDGFVVMRKEL